MKYWLLFLLMFPIYCTGIVAICFKIAYLAGNKAGVKIVNKAFGEE